MNNKLVNFGKYKNQPIDIMLEDTKYCNWVLSQEEMKIKYTWVFQAIQNAIQLEDTPEHNALQNRFLNKDYCIKVGNYFFELNKEKFQKELQTNYIDFTDKTDMTINEEIIDGILKELTCIVLKEFVNLISIFNIYNLDNYQELDLKEYTDFYFKEYNLEEYLIYFRKIKNDYFSRDRKEYETKEKSIGIIINKIKEELSLKLKPLLSFSKIEEPTDKIVFFSLDNKYLIKYDCHIEKSRTYHFDISFEDKKLFIQTNKIIIYKDNPNELLKKVIKLIDDDNNTRNVNEAIFEKDNVDVVYIFYPSKRSFDFKLGIELKIELKPTISEDYPNIMRKAIKDKINIVFCDKITTTSTSIENIKKIYKRNNIDLIISSDLYTLSIENKNNDIVGEYLKKIDMISNNGKCDTNEVKNLILEFSKLYS